MEKETGLRKLFVQHNRRLQKLRELQAIQGINTPPEILIEIEDIEIKLEQLTKTLESIGEVPSSPKDFRSKVEIRISADFSRLSAEEVAEIIQALAVALDVPNKDIRILSIREGSIVFELELSDRAFEQLMNLYKNGTPIVLRVKNQSFEIDNILPLSTSTKTLSKKKPQIFLSYSRRDEEQVHKLYTDLYNSGFKPWMDKEDIVPGEQWALSISRAIKQSDFFLACISRNSVNRRGFLQKEIRDGLEIWREKLEDDIYLIPVRLENCVMPENLKHLQWVDLFNQDGVSRLVNALHIGLQRLDYTDL